MKIAQETRSNIGSKSLAWISIVLSLGGIVAYGASLRIIPDSARSAALEGSDPYATQITYWGILFILFFVAAATGMFAKKRASSDFLAGVGAGAGVLGVLLIVVNYLSFYSFR